MKKILYLLLLLPFFSYAQNPAIAPDDDGFDYSSIPVQNGTITYQEEDETFYTNKEDAYSKVKQMMQEFIDNAQLVVQKEDKSTGIFIGKLSTYNFLDNVSMMLRIKVDAGQYTATLSSFERQIKVGDKVLTEKYDLDLLYLVKNKEAQDGPHRTKLYAMHQSARSVLNRINARLAKDYEY